MDATPDGGENEAGGGEDQQCDEEAQCEGPESSREEIEEDVSRILGGNEEIGSGLCGNVPIRLGVECSG